MTNGEIPGAGHEEFRQASGRPTAPGGLPAGRAEARRHSRFLIFGAVAELRRRGPATLFGLLRKSTSGIVVDLSEGGARISIGVELPVDTPVELVIEVDRFKDRISCDGLVRWCRSGLATPPAYHVGIMFENLSPSTQKKIGQMRSWFTSDHCSEFRERKNSSEKNLPKIAAPATAGGVSRIPGTQELEAGFWAISAKGAIEGPALEIFATAVDDLLGAGAHGLLVDLGGTEAGSARDLTGFLKVIDRAEYRGAKIVFVASPPALQAQIEAKSAGKRIFAADYPSGCSLIRPDPPGSARG